MVRWFRKESVKIPYPSSHWNYLRWPGRDIDFFFSPRLLFYYPQLLFYPRPLFFIRDFFFFTRDFFFYPRLFYPTLFFLSATSFLSAFFPFCVCWLRTHLHWTEQAWEQAIWQQISRAKITGKNNGFPFLDILGYLKNTHKNPKFGKVKQVQIRELGWERKPSVLFYNASGFIISVYNLALICNHGLFQLILNVFNHFG